MGNWNEYDHDLPEDPDAERGPDGRKQNDQAPLVGEIEWQPHPRRKYGRAYEKGQTDYDDKFVRGVIFFHITHPHWSYRRMADYFGVSKETIRRWTSNDIDRRKVDADTPRLRAEGAQVLDAIGDEAWKLYELALATRRPRYALDALQRLESVVTTKAKLLGTNMPVRVDVQHTAVTEAELELQKIIDEAKARTEAREAEVIAQASADPDL